MTPPGRNDLGKEKSMRVNGYEMAYIECGEGEPLLLVHGSLSDYRVWSFQMRPFSRYYRTIAVSLRHFYPEQWNGEGDDFSLRQHVNDLHEFVRLLDVGPVHLMAHSRGGDVGLVFAAEYPRLVRSVVLIDPAPLDVMLPKTPDVMKEVEKRKVVVSQAIDRMMRGDIDGGLEMFIDTVSVPGNWKRLPEPVKQMRRENAWSLKCLASDAQEPIDCAAVRAIDAPVLFVTAEKSPAFYGMMIAALQPYLEQQRKITISNASHGMFIEQPAAFNAAVLDFFAGIRSDPNELQGC